MREYPKYVKSFNKTVILMDKSLHIKYKLLDDDVIDIRFNSGSMPSVKITNETIKDNIYLNVGCALCYMPSHLYGTSKSVDIVRHSELAKAIITNKHFYSPKFIYVTNSYKLIDVLEDNTNYVFKTFYQARGLGKIHFNTSDTETLKEFLEFNTKKLTPKLNKFKKNEDNEKNKLPDEISEGIFFEDIGYEGIEEYRVLIFNNKKFLLEKRTNYHPLSPYTREHVVTTKIPDILIEDIDRILEQLDKIRIDSNYPFASFDLYINTKETEFEKRYGIFEYCVQFGDEYPLNILKEIKYDYTVSLVEFIMEKTQGFISPSRKRDFRLIGSNI